MTLAVAAPLKITHYFLDTEWVAKKVQLRTQLCSYETRNIVYIVVGYYDDVEEVA